jgi:hypothetical protein
MGRNNNSKALDPRKSADSSETKDAASMAAPVVRRRVLSDEDPLKGSAERTSPDDRDLVTAIVPKPFKFTCDDGTTIDYDVGVQDMPKKHANHWWSKAQGVSIKEDAVE